MRRLANILYVMDGDLNGMKALEQVMTLASEHNANLTLLDVIKSLPPATRMLITSASTGDL